MNNFVASLLVLLGLVNATCFDRIAGFRPESDVAQHARIDLDVATIDILADSGDFAGALGIYTNGENSAKSASLRTIKGFSLDAEAKMAGQVFYEMYKGFWGSETYSDDFVQRAAAATEEFVDLPAIAQAEGVTKGMQYQVIWMYIIRELEDAVDDCQASNETQNDNGVKAVDEAWAFYAGSLEGTEGGSSGKILFNLAAKRCAQFGRCDPADGKSIVNKEVVALFAQMQTLLRLGQCSAAAALIPSIVSDMTIPLVQGTMRYIHRGNSNEFSPGTTTDFKKERAEGWAFLAAILPQVDACNSAVATTLQNNMIPNAVNYMGDGALNVASQLQSTFSCMGISCADVGEMVEGATVVFPQCAESGAFVVKGSMGMAMALVAMLALF